MAKRNGVDLAQVLLSKARADEQAVGVLLDADLPDGVVGFHAQQAVEKALKAVLAARGVEYEFSHDLAYLGELLESKGIELPDEVRVGEELRPWAIEFRYEDPGNMPGLDRQHARETAAAAVRWAADSLASSGL